MKLVFYYSAGGFENVSNHIQMPVLVSVFSPNVQIRQSQNDKQVKKKLHTHCLLLSD